jgi:hypothetical protein
MRPFIKRTLPERILGVMAQVRATRSWGAIARTAFLAILTTSIFAVGARVLFFGVPEELTVLFKSETQVATAAAAVTSPFLYEFRIPGTLIEAGSSDESSSPYWWLDSGGKMIIQDDTGKTVQGSLPTLDKWRLRYSRSSSIDTEDGHAPQNLFRLVSRSNWDNVRVESSFRIIRDNFTESPNRDASNGLLLMSRYQDQNNLYYAGIRVDGRAIIKKKSDGVYYTMVEKQIFDGYYSKKEDVNLIPHNEWISLRSETTTAKNGAVTVKLFMKRAEESKWTQLLSVVDDGKKFENTEPITGEYPIGIRTDFMDVEFDNIRVEKM